MTGHPSDRDPFGALARLDTAGGAVEIASLRALERAGLVDDLSRLPHTVKVLLENVLRRAGGAGTAGATGGAEWEEVEALAAWRRDRRDSLSFMPSRVLMQDFTGVPAVVDLAAMRSAVARAGGDPHRVNPLVPVDLVIDHSVQVDRFGGGAYRINLDWEYRRNGERYALLKWAQQAFDGFRVVPPGMGICHQVNLEHLARVVLVRDGLAHPDTLVGTDSHTTMVNGLGVLGWGVGGIEAEAAMLGQPMGIAWPVVVGVRLSGALPAGSTATDLVLTLTQLLRSHGVVGSFVEFFGPGLPSLEVADRATLSNMCPEYGATAALFPVDGQTLRYLRETGRGDVTDLVERYTREQGLFASDGGPEPEFDETVDLDLSSVQASLAGPRRPQDRVALSGVWRSFVDAFADRIGPQPERQVERFLDEGGESAMGQPEPAVPLEPQPEVAREPTPAEGLDHGSVVIAAITSCTNTSNPSVMVAAGLLAKKAVEAGLLTRPWVKTSMAPGSRVVTDYLERAGLTPYLEKLGFDVVGYGCTTCIGNSGPLPEEVAAAVQERDLVVCAVLSGNRNFEGRIHPQVRASYLASPPLCVAYALAGRVDLDLGAEPLGVVDGREVHLADIWPTPEEVRAVVAGSLSPQEFEAEYAKVFEGDERWAEIAAPAGALFEWDPASTYVREPPFMDPSMPVPEGDLDGARVLAMLGDSVTTDHISPAGSIPPDTPAGRYLQEHGVRPGEFNSYGSRRGNHEVMMRGTFANVRLRNRLAPGTEGGWTVHLPGGEETSIYEASLRYRDEGVPLLVIAGREYGSGSSRDWAAKGTALLGVRAVIAESYERIHRSNLVGMGVLPLQFLPGESAGSLGLTGRETYSVRGLDAGVGPGRRVEVEATGEDGSRVAFQAVVRIDSDAEAATYRAGGILRQVAERMSEGR